MIREAVVAGSFYPSRAGDLDNFFTSVIKPEKSTQTVKAIIVPHAGYVYSGKIAAKVYSQVALPENIVLLGPNHTGRGTPISVFEKGAWLTPYGKVPVNEAFTKDLLSRSPLGTPDVVAHLLEHSLEVHLPFLQYLKKKDLAIVPVAIAEHRRNILRDFASALAETIKNSPQETLIIASTDFTHHETAARAKEKDYLCFAAIQSLDEEKLYDEVKEKNISMCGIYPVYVAIIAAKKLGATKSELVVYGTSGDTTGDKTEVVGYGGLTIY
jgi:MEMO1 family protein